MSNIVNLAKKEIKVFVAGKNASRGGADVSKNPHPFGSRLATIWENGFYHEKAEKTERMLGS